MQIIPAIDLKDGKVVRLTQGDFNRVEEYDLDPVKKAKEFKDSGAEWLHVVDLEGALNGRFQPENIPILKRIAKEAGIKVQFGGGVRNIADVQTILDYGVSRVIVGTLSQENINFVKEAVKKFGDKFSVSIDAKNNILYKRGWSESSKVEMGVFLKDLESCGVKMLVYTNISKDGMLQGPDIEGVKNILSLTKIPLIASGGISSLEDIKKLKELNVWGVIIGKAIYKGKIDLKEAIKYVS